MSLNTGSGKLAFALKTLSECWQDTRDSWQDRVRDEFEENYLEPLESEVLSTQNAISSLAQILEKAREECA